MHDVTTISKRNVCSFIVTLNAFYVGPTFDTADVQAILLFPPNPLKHVLCDVSDCGVDALPQFWWCLWKWWDVNIVLDETTQEEITHCQVWWPGWPGAEGVVCGRCTTNPSTWFTLFPRDGSGDYRTIPNVTFTVCNRHEFHDLATLPTQVMAQRNPPIIYAHPVCVAISPKPWWLVTKIHVAINYNTWNFITTFSRCP